MGNGSSSPPPSPPPEPYVPKKKDDDDLTEIKAQKYDTIRRESKDKAELWKDPLFPTTDNSIYWDGNSRFNVTWLRPQEMEFAQLEGSTPRFYVKGPSRFDLIQGELGDCWLLASLAALAERPDLIQQVIPDHKFYTKYSGYDYNMGYCGVFRFRFYHFGEWVEVCVDDRLPTYNGRLLMVHSNDGHEFWGALVEKAYAKLFGCYEALKGGVCADALSDLTGGVCESYRLKKTTPDNLNVLMDTAAKRGSLICTGIWGDASNNSILPNGLVTGHAYTISDIEKLYLTGGETLYLVRIRNPWGDKTEWTGRWSDRSVVWQYVPERVKLELEHRLRDDGEFWMDYKDFVLTFDDVDICHLKPDSLTEEVRDNWKITVFHGQWRGRTAGGRMKYRNSFGLNPQYIVSLMDSVGDSDRYANLLVELTQKHRRKTREENLNIGFVIYKLSDDAKLPLSYDYFTSHERAGAVDYYTNLRTVTKRFAIKPGRYVIVASTWDPGEEAEFVLRIWSEVDHSARLDMSRDVAAARRLATEKDRSIDEELVDSGYRSVQRVDPFMNEEAAKFFRDVSGEDMALNAYELQSGLNKLYASEQKFNFDINCCKAIIAHFDSAQGHKLEWKDFVPMYGLLNLSANVFSQNDSDSDGFVCGAEFVMALKRQNYGATLTIEPHNDSAGLSLVSELIFRFSDQNGKISFNDYVHAVIKLQTAKDGFEKFKEKGKNKLRIPYSQWIQTVVKP